MGRSHDSESAEVQRWRNLSRERPARVDRPGPGQESVWNYPRPPRVEPETARVRVELAGIVVADSGRTLRVLETASPPTYYIPAADVRAELLVESPHSTLCEWKGTSRHWSLRVGERLARDAAWGYPEPFPGFEALRDHLAFYAGRVDACFLGEERVRPQDADYYGGWITARVVGPFKGPPGTQHW